MKNLDLKITQLLFLFFLILSINHTKAQAPLFEELLNQMTSTQQANFLNDFNNLDNEFDLDLFQDTGVLEELLNTILDGTPTLDHSYSDAFSVGYGYLGFGYSSTILDSTDVDLIGEDYFRLDTIFDGNFEDLQNISSTYQDDLLFDEQTTIDLEAEEDDINFDLFNLQETLLEDGADASADGLGDFSSILDQLFSPQQFPLLELGFGVQKADITYWANRYLVDTKVIRVGSVLRTPSLETTVEGRWHMQASWIDEPIGGGGEIPAGVSKEIQPLLLDGACSAMVARVLFCSEVLEGRLLTTLGAEVGTYAPAHDKDFLPKSRDNKGYTTGLGPQAGLGFSIRALDVGLTFYSLTTIAYGDVLSGPSNYRYQSTRAEAGVNFNDIVNIRYATGTQNWAPDGLRRVHRGHEVIVGIILNSLNR